jgi:hypothetical protein
LSLEKGQLEQAKKKQMLICIKQWLSEIAVIATLIFRKLNAQYVLTYYDLKSIVETACFTYLQYKASMNVNSDLFSPHKIN